MELAAHISQKDVHSEWNVFNMRVFRYLQTGYLLHGITLISTFASWKLSVYTLSLLREGAGIFHLALFVYLTLYSFTLIFFSQLDARSRFQNYKLVKDKFYEYGFNLRLLRPFVYSRCQRDAIAVAARDLDFQLEWNKLTLELGFRWYHLLPHLVIRNPRILFRKDYWSKTLFVPTYHSKYFLW